MKIELENSKYTYVFDETSGKQYALRYGEEWRDLTGDRLVLAMAQKIEKLENALADIAVFLGKEIIVMKDESNDKT